MDYKFCRTTIALRLRERIFKVQTVAWTQIQSTNGCVNAVSKYAWCSNSHPNDYTFSRTNGVISLRLRERRINSSTDAWTQNQSRYAWCSNSLPNDYKISRTNSVIALDGSVNAESKYKRLRERIIKVLYGCVNAELKYKRLRERRIKYAWCRIHFLRVPKTLFCLSIRDLILRIINVSFV